MKSFFAELIEYSFYYNQALATEFLNHGDVLQGNSVRLFSHMLNAHRIWNCRIQQVSPPFAVWQLHDIQDFKRIDEESYQQTLAILDSIDLEQTIDYTNTKGDTFTNTVRDILFHVVNHSTYHRGQLALEFKQLGVQPLSTDFIFYKR
jgi:uncharacterized damage-inducible protein DinB